MGPLWVTKTYFTLQVLRLLYPFLLDPHLGIHPGQSEKPSNKRQARIFQRKSCGNSCQGKGHLSSGPRTAGLGDSSGFLSLGLCCSSYSTSKREAIRPAVAVELENGDDKKARQNERTKRTSTERPSDHSCKEQVKLEAQPLAALAQ